MFLKNIVFKVLEKCLIIGGDFVEIFEEDIINNFISLIDNKVENVIGGRNYGIGIRIFKGLKSIYVYISDNLLNSLLDVVYKVVVVLGKLEDGKSVILNDSIKINNIYNIKIYLNLIGNKDKVSVMKVVYKSVKEFSNDIF